MIDQELLIPTLATSSGGPSITIAQLVALMVGESLPMIDQTLLIPTLRGRAGLPAETIADIVALAGGAPPEASTVQTITDRAPTNWWRGSQLPGSLSVGDLGNKPIGFGEAVGSPVYAASQPMALEDITTAIELGGAETFTASEVLVYTEGTFFMFVRLTTNAGVQTLFSQANVGGGSQLTVNTQGGGVLQCAILRDGGGNILNSVLTLSAALVLDTWHLISVRQAGDGVGLRWFIDGAFFNPGDAEISQSTGGVGDVDWWFEETASASIPATTVSIGSTIAGGALTNPLNNAQFFDGLVDEDFWSDAEMTALWNQAEAQQLS